MDTDLLAREFRSDVAYLNTASHGLMPARCVTRVQGAVARMATGDIDMPAYFAVNDGLRAAFARVTGTTADRVALGNAVSVHVGLVAAGLPAGSEVLVAEGEFSSVVNPFAVRDDLRVRQAPLEKLAEAVDGDTALVAVAAVQSADGRVADLAAIREATRAVGARLLVDMTQAVWWLPLPVDSYDYVVCAGYKWLLCPRGTSFLVVSREAQEAGALVPLHAGWSAGEDPWASCYGPVERLAPGARRYEESVSFLPYLGAAASLGLVEELGADAVRAHDLGLADRFRAGVERLGHRPVPGESAIVAVPGLGRATEALAGAGIRVSQREGNLRVSFHLYNTEAQVDRALDVLEGVRG